MRVRNRSSGGLVIEIGIPTAQPPGRFDKKRVSAE
jgi:hypothetical protein